MKQPDGSEMSKMKKTGCGKDALKTAPREGQTHQSPSSEELRLLRVADIREDLQRLCAECRGLARNQGGELRIAFLDQVQGHASLPLGGRDGRIDAQLIKIKFLFDV